MNKLFPIVLALIFISFAFSVREEILSRHSNGNKKLVIKYKGYGSNETVVERITYSDTDKVLRKEKPLEKDITEMTYYDNGHLKDVKKYKNDKKDGEWHEYYDNGQLKKNERYMSGKKTGIWHTYYDSGKLDGRRVYSKNGEPTDYASYYENGELSYKVIYENGESIHSYSYSKDGELSGEKHYGNIYKDPRYPDKSWAEFREFTRTEYYEDGTISGEYVYGQYKTTHIQYHKNGNLYVNQTIYYPEGRSNLHDRENYKTVYSDESIYYETGTIKEIRHYNGKDWYSMNLIKSGEWIYYNEDGSVWDTRTYKNGELVGK